MFPFLADWYIFPHERDIQANAFAVRNVVRQVIETRRKEQTKVGGGDLLSILLSDPLFSENVEVMIDELLTIFFAGSQTTANATQNLILHLLQHPKYEQAILDELDAKIVKPSGTSDGKRADILDLYTHQNIEELELYQNCFNEALRN